MEIRQITSQTAWTQFFDLAGSPSFLQSWDWGEFQNLLGQEILYLGLYNNNNLQAIALVEKVRARRGNFLFIPHGPIFETQKLENSKTRKYINGFKKYLVAIAKNEKYSFIRIGSVLENTPANERLFSNLGFKKSPIYIHSENSWVLPLDKSEEEILSRMRKTTRYLIRKAVKENVVIEKRTDKKAVNDFLEVYRETVKRENFSAYPDDYIINEFESFNKTRNALFFIGKHQGKVLAAALVLFTHSCGFYHQGASIHTKIPVPYLLQWEAIKEAKKRGCSLYNFWGTLIPGRTPKNWEGLTTFKTGFGGFEKQYIPTQDYVISKKYYLTYFYEKFLAWRRGV